MENKKATDVSVAFSIIEKNPSNLTKPQKTFNLNLTFKNL